VWKKLSIPWGHAMVVEVGCGVGEWVCYEAARHPATHYLAIEKTQTRSGPLQQRAARSRLTNLTAIRADAVLFLDQLCPPASVDAFYFFYPNPWPKKVHAQRRLLIGPSMWVFNRCLKPGGQIYLATNVDHYAQEAAENLQQAWGYAISRHARITSLATPRTAFERKYLTRGETLYELNLKKPTS
jgi:tRNA (guanine-N7-)-methyltransferase